MSKFVKTFFLTMFLVSAAFSENAGFGSIASDRNKPIQFTSDSLIFNQKDNIAELFDEVEIIQGHERLDTNSKIQHKYLKEKNGNKTLII